MQSSTSPPGARIGKYRILAHIATGGMGAVYKARDELLGRVVALKVLAPELAQNPILIERFKREARHAARLAHKNIVTLYESDEADGLHYLAMEFIEGIDLSEYIRRKVKIEPEEARRIIIQACKALEHAFSMGVTHRDIKPSNFLLANEEGRCRVKLTDLGLARMINEEEFRVTRAGTTVGTVDYMAPEQARDATLADVRSDIYSLGCTLYHMLAGHPPFAEGGIGERVYKHLASDPQDIRQFNPEVSASLWTVLRRMLAKHPDDRFQTPTEVIEALRSIGEPLTPTWYLVDEDSTEAPFFNSRSPTPVPEGSSPTSPTPAPPEKLPDNQPPGSTSAPTRSTRSGGSPRRKRKTTIAETSQTPADALPDTLGITPEQRNAAMGQFTHATEVIRAGGDPAYPIQLLLSCCKLDPNNLVYRKLLREVVRDQHRGKKGSWFGSLTNYPARSRIRAAKKAGELRTVLEDGEDLLTRLPGDVPTQLDMAEAAEALGLMQLAVWLLEEAQRGAGQDRSVLRALARLYEIQRRYPNAIAQWEKVRNLDPSDAEANEKIKELAVNETLDKNNLRR
jgi:serine/threonine-protein kinase